MELITSRAVIGAYYARLDAGNNLAWVNGCANLFNSDQESETYAWLGMSPAMREWVGGRNAKGLKESSVTIRNKHYEATLEIALRDIRRDKSGQIMARVNDFADRAQTHWASLLSALIIAGESAVCYDGQYFFDTDHVDGANQTNQSNDLSIDISALPAAVHGSTTAPSAEEMQQCILQAIAAIVSFKDDQGEPMNESASEFVVVVPPSMYLTALSAVTNATLTSGAFNILPNVPGMRISVQMNARLSWTAQFAVFRTDGSVKALIRQQETEGELKAKAEGSEYEFDNDAWQFGIDSWRNVGYGYWQQACLVTMT